MFERTFTKTSVVPHDPRTVFDWHTRPGAFDRLSPPWDKTTVHDFGGIRDGQRVTLRVHAPWPRKWIAEHEDYIDGTQFKDRQIKGPFPKWVHTHRFAPAPGSDSLDISPAKPTVSDRGSPSGGGDGDGGASGGDATSMTDHIDFKLPLGPLGVIAHRLFMRRQIETMFAHRHRTVAQDLDDHARIAQGKKLTVAITGASGGIGRELTAFLTTGGHTVRPVARRDHPAFDLDALRGADVVVHLAGEPIFQRWNDKVKERLHSSRIDRTRWLCEQIASLPPELRPKVLLSGSAIGIYGSRGDETLTENSSRGEGYLADLAADWEAATQTAADAGIRVALLRTGVVLTPRGGALKQMLPIFKLGLGGRLSDGKAWFPWIHIDDHVRAVYTLICGDNFRGPFNLTAPHPVTNAQFTRTLGEVLRRPAVLPAPAFALRLAFGEMADEALLMSARVLPGRLEEAGFRFRHPMLEGALRALLGKA